MTPPDIAVVIASHDRPLRLRWLLNALEEQTLDRDRWEVVVAHDSADPATPRLLETHPLAAAGLLRHETLLPGSAPPGANRNAGWRAARAPLVAFTDDDCRPPPTWLAAALDAARRSPDAVVQGATRPDPDELELLRAPHRHTQHIDPPVAYAQACNILYPRRVLEDLGGFDESLLTGEDTELAARARRAGVPYLGAPEVLTYHAVQPLSLARALRSASRWEDLAAVVKRHPELRRHFPLRIFWKRSHACALLALAGALQPRRPLATLLALPWALSLSPGYGPTVRGRIRAVSELPGRALIDLAEVTALARGSLRHRTLFL